MLGFIGNLWSNSVDWVNSRWSERTSQDGIILIGVGLVALFFTPLLKIAAWGAIIYGAYTLIKSEY